MPKPPESENGTAATNVWIDQVSKSVANAVDGKLQEFEARLDERLLQLGTTVACASETSTPSNGAKSPTASRGFYSAENQPTELLIVDGKDVSGEDGIAAEDTGWADTCAEDNHVNGARCSKMSRTSDAPPGLMTATSTTSRTRRHQSGDFRSELAKRLAISATTSDMVRDGTGPLQRKCATIVTHTVFDATFGLLIFVNSLVTGMEVEYMTTHSVNHHIFCVSSIVFGCIFFVELVCRLLAAGTLILHMADREWIGFDLFMVLVSCAELTVYNLGEAKLGGVLSAVRTVRILRLLRIVRVLRFVPSLRMIIASIKECLKTLFWAVILLLIFLYFFSLCFTMASTEHSKNSGMAPDDPTALEIETHFGTVARSLYSCLKAMLNGQSWGELMDPLLHVDAVYAAIFIAFVVISMLMLLNIVTGAFVNGAMERTAHEREVVAEREIHRRTNVLEYLKQIFMESDEDRTGVITQEQFSKHMKDPSVEPYIAALNIDTSNIHDLFELLDADGSGAIDLHEFVTNLLDLMHQANHGSAKQIRKLMHHMHRIKIQLHQVHANTKGMQSSMGNEFGGPQPQVSF